MRVTNDFASLNIVDVQDSVKKNLSQNPQESMRSETESTGTGLNSRLVSLSGNVDATVKEITSSMTSISSANSILDQSGGNLNRMRELAVKYQSSSISDAERANIEVEFKFLQMELSRSSSKYKNTAQASGLYLYRNEVASPSENGESSQPSRRAVLESESSTDISLTASKGSVKTDNGNAFSSDESKSSADPLEYAVSMNIDEKDSVKKIDAAMDYTSAAILENSSKQKKLEDAYMAVMDDESARITGNALINSMDMAQKSTLLTSDLIGESADNALLSQGSNIGDAAVLVLFR